jgi:hypothetical protein
MRSADDIIFEELDSESDGFRSLYTHNDVVKAMKLYAKEAIEEQLKIAADCATTIREQGLDYYASYVVNKYSITNCTRIELL